MYTYKVLKLYSEFYNKIIKQCNILILEKNTCSLFININVWGSLIKKYQD